MGADGEEEEEGVGLAPEVAKEVPAPSSSGSKGGQPRGRVVGIIKRNWKP